MGFSKLLKAFLRRARARPFERVEFKEKRINKTAGQVIYLFIHYVWNVHGFVPYIKFTSVATRPQLATFPNFPRFISDLMKVDRKTGAPQNGDGRQKWRKEKEIFIIVFGGVNENFVFIE